MLLSERFIGRAVKGFTWFGKGLDSLSDCHTSATPTSYYVYDSYSFIKFTKVNSTMAKVDNLLTSTKGRK